VKLAREKGQTVKHVNTHPQIYFFMTRSHALLLWYSYGYKSKFGNRVLM